VIVSDSHILEKAFDCRAPGDKLGCKVIHLCCCLSCPLHAKRSDVDDTKCILHTAQQWPVTSPISKSAAAAPIIHHWHQVDLGSLASASTTIFLHGLGPDFMSKFDSHFSDEDAEAFAKLSGHQERWAFIAGRMTSKNVVRVTFDGTENWNSFDLDQNPCVVFHRLVSATMP
jgi:hypothetical protein